MRRLIVASFILLLVILPVLAQEEIDITEMGGSEAMAEEVRGGVIKMFTDMFGLFTGSKMEGVVGPYGLFSAEFLAAFFIIYFLVGSATGFQISQGPAQFVGTGLPKILVTLIFTFMVWNTFGGMRYELFLILLIPPMMVYYILTSVLTNFALIRGRIVQVIAVSAATITFFFYSPQLINYIEGRFVYGVLDGLALSAPIFFVVYMFGFFLTKFTNEVISPINNQQAATNRSIRQQIKQLPEKQKRNVTEILNLLNAMKGVG
jgi:hypothetical protein